MQHSTPTVSIIIVNYKVEDEILACIRSIHVSESKTSFEIILVDNNDHDRFGNVLKKTFPEVRYVKPVRNGGFGAGNNTGAKVSKGEYLFFLNPDTKVFFGTIDTLFEFISKDTSVGMVAPLLIDQKGRPFSEQGAKLLTPWNCLFVYTIVHRVFPKNPIANSFWERTWDKKQIRRADAVPGTAFMIRKKLFDEVLGFDETFFLYFEEFDLGQKMKKKEKVCFILPQARVYHKWGASTKGNVNTKKIFAKSRLHYFTKYYGILPALIVEIASRVGKREILAFSICIVVLLALII